MIILGEIMSVVCDVMQTGYCLRFVSFYFLSLLYVNLQMQMSVKLILVSVESVHIASTH